MQRLERNANDQLVARPEDQEDYVPEDLAPKGKVAGKSKNAGGKMMPFYDPYASMYCDPYGFPAKGKGKMLAIKGDWADTYDDDSAWWYPWVRRRELSHFY